MAEDALDESERLEALGLTPAQARAYVALLREGHVGAKDVAAAVGVTRASAYTALRSLADLGMVEAGAGYGSRYRAVAPEQALPALIDRQRAELTAALADRESVAKHLITDLAGLVERESDGPGEVVEVIRNRRVMSERFDRLQLEARAEIATVVKAPIVTSGDANPAQDVALARGIRVRGLYEEAVLEHPDVEPYLRSWVAGGEEARLYPGVLPLKFAVFDSSTVLLPLETPDDRYELTTLLIRHPALGGALRLLYEYLWRESEPLE